MVDLKINGQLIFNITLKFIREWIEVQGSGDAESSDQFWGGDKAVSGGIGVITAGEVSVV